MAHQIKVWSPQDGPFDMAWLALQIDPQAWWMAFLNTLEEEDVVQNEQKPEFHRLLMEEGGRL
jgi:hypothetical protein